MPGILLKSLVKFFLPNRRDIEFKDDFVNLPAVKKRGEVAEKNRKNWEEIKNLCAALKQSSTPKSRDDLLGKLRDLHKQIIECEKESDVWTKRVISEYEVHIKKKQHQALRVFDYFDKLYLAIAARESIEDEYKGHGGGNPNSDSYFVQLARNSWRYLVGGRRASILPRRPRQVDVSIVMGTYNRRALLIDAIAAVRRNGFTGSMEIIVIDGGSTDGTLEWLIDQKDIVSIVQHNHGEFDGKPIESRSWGYFMNLGFKIAQGKYVLMLSDDCIVHKGAIQNGFDHFEGALADSRKIGALAFYFRNWPAEETYFVQATLGSKLMVNHGMYLSEALAEVNWIDETTYEFYKADSDLALRLWQAGYTIEDCPTAFVEHLLDEDEANRQRNAPLMESDREAYNMRWQGIYTSVGGNKRKFKVGGRQTIDYEDTHQTFRVLEPHLRSSQER